jgi:perosamine synthetase
VLLSDAAGDRDGVMETLRRRGIETRPIVHPLHSLPPYAEANKGQRFPVAQGIARRGINLPTWAGLTRDQVRSVCDSLLECLAAVKAV